MTFKNKGSMHGMYVYSIPITGEELEMTTKIFLFKTSWWKIYDLNINIDIHAEDELWNADVFVEVDGRVYRQTFFDIENKAVEIQVD